MAEINAPRLRSVRAVIDAVAVTECNRAVDRARVAYPIVRVGERDFACNIPGVGNGYVRKRANA